MAEVAQAEEAVAEEASSHQLPAREDSDDGRWTAASLWLAALSSGGFGLDVVFDPAQHLQELLTIELEAGDVLFDLACDLVNGDEEGQLAVAQGVEQLGLVRRHTENGLPIGHELHLCEVIVHVTGATQVIPCSANPLHGHSIVEK